MIIKQLLVVILLLQFTFNSFAQNANFDPNLTYRIINLWQGDNKALDIVNDGKQNNLPRLGVVAEKKSYCSFNQRSIQLNVCFILFGTSPIDIQ